MNTPRKIILLGVALIVVVGAVVLYSNSRKPAPKSSRTSNQALSNSVADADPDAQVVPVPAALKTAVGCALYIGEVQRAVPSEHDTARRMLGALQPTLFISDYIMAAKSKTNGLQLSKAAIMQAYQQQVPADKSALAYRLDSYGSFSGSLTDHYARVRSRGEALPAVEAVVRDTGLPVDLESDLLIDCLRFACFHTEVEEMYGPLKNPLDTHEPNPQEAAACQQTFKQVFNYRFANRYSLSEATATKLIEKLSQLTVPVSTLTPEDVEPPAVLH